LGSGDLGMNGVCLTGCGNPGVASAPTAVGDGLAGLMGAFVCAQEASMLPRWVVHSLRCPESCAVEAVETEGRADEGRAAEHCLMLQPPAAASR